MERRHRGLTAVAAFVLLCAWTWRAGPGHALSSGVFSPRETGAALGGALLDLLLAALLALGLKSLGGALLRRLLGEVRLPVWLPAAELPAGMALAGTALLAAGLGGLYTPAFVGACALGLAGAGALHARRRAVPLPRPPEDALRALFLGAAAFLAWASILRALAPPIDPDTLKYHLALPELYLRAGRVHDIPWHVFARQPHAMALLYGLPLSLGRESAAPLLHAAACASAAAAVFLAAREELGPEAAAWSAGLLLSQPLFWHQARGALSDGALMGAVVACLLSLRRWRAEGAPAMAAAAGLFAGGAAAVKLHGLLFAALASAWVLARALRRDAAARRGAAAFAAAAALLAGPWYLKAWAASGNPVWPYLAGLLGGDAGPEVVAGWVKAGGLRLPSESALHFMLFGDGAAFLLAPTAAGVLWAALGGRRPPGLALALSAPLLFYAPAVLTSVSAWRYCLPFVPGLAVAFGWAAAELLRAKPGARPVLALGPALGLWAAFSGVDPTALYPVAGLRSRSFPAETARDGYRLRHVPFEPMRRLLARTLGSGERVLLFGDDAVLGLAGRYMFGEPYHQGVVRWLEYPTPRAALAALRAQGVTHLCLNRSGDWNDAALARLAPALRARVFESAELLADPVGEAGGRVLYRLR